MATAELDHRGWHLSSEGIAQCSNGGDSRVDSIIKKALDADLRDIGCKWLDEDINRGKLDYVEGPSVLQLQKLRVISAPKDNEESQGAPKLCRLSLTDGLTTCSAVTLEPIKGLGGSTPPGSKLLVKGTVEVETNFLLLTDKNTTVLGGRVDILADPWELKKTLAKQSQVRTGTRGEGGAPLFVPFGKKISDPLPPVKKDNFKSLATPKDKKPEEDSEFQQQRQATIKQALQAKSTSGGVKVFGGGQKPAVNNKEVAHIVEMGFSPEEAMSALKISNGSLREAVNSLLSGGPRYQRGGGGGERGGRSGYAQRGNGHSEARGDGRRKGREREFEQEGEGSVNTRPSGPATLFDFLETKIPNKEESKRPARAFDSKQAYSSASSAPPPHFVSSKNRDSGYPKPDRRPQTAYPSSYSSESSYNHRTHEQRDDSRSYHYNSSDSQTFGVGEENSSHWRQQQQQSVPPRFAKMGRGDGGQRGGQGQGGGPGGRGPSDKTGAYTNQNRKPLRENSENQFHKGGYNQGGRSQNYPQGKVNNSNNSTQNQKEIRPNKDQSSSDFKKQPYNVERDKVLKGKGSSGYDKQRNNQKQSSAESESSYQNSSRADTRESKPPFNGPSNKSHHHQQSPSLMSGYPSQPLHSQQFPFPGKQCFNGQQFPGRNGLPVGVGETCLAKYWEDNEFYPAVVEAIAPDGSTVVVTFLDYRNQEEVLVRDVQPLQQPGWAFQMSPGMYNMPGMNPQDAQHFQGGGASFVPPMEFTRGGSYYSNNGGGGGGSYRRHDGGDRRKPTQPYYNPPNQKS